MKILSKILFPNIYLLNFESQYELCMSFVRMQEFYESPKFKGRYFTLEQYMDYWCKEFGGGVFTYTTTCKGFNVPGMVLSKWAGKFSERDDIRTRENNILKQIYGLIRKETGFILPDDIEKIYVIGTYGKDNLAIDHELAHAIYYLYPEYNKSCKKLLKEIPKKDYIVAKNKLIEMGYSNKMIDDELQAYFSTNRFQHSKYSVLGSRIEFVNNYTIFKTTMSLKK